MRVAADQRVPRPNGESRTRLSITVVIPTWDGWTLLESCLESLAAQTRPADAVVVVDNGSRDGTVERLERDFPWVQIVRFETNTGFAVAVNAGIDASCSDAVVLLNNDARAEPGWLAELERITLNADDRVGFVTSKILDGEGVLIESVGDVVDRAGVPHQSGHGEPDVGSDDQVREVFSGCGGATLYRRSMLDDIGGFDERFFAYYEDVDLCFRAQLLGYRGLVAPGARVRHAGSTTSARVPGLKIRLSTRNGWWLVAKNVPAPLLAQTLGRLAIVNVAKLALAARAGSTDVSAMARGHLQAVRGLPAVLADRRAVQSRRVVSARQVRERMPATHLPLRAAIMGARALDRYTGGRGRAPFNPDAASRYAPVARKVGRTQRVLEIGSGNAGLTDYLPREVIGGDFDLGATAELSSDRLHRLRADAARLPVASGSCDVVVSVDMLEHLAATHRPAALREMLRVLRPGGRLLLAFPNGPRATSLDARLDADWVHLRGQRNPWLEEHASLGLPDSRHIRQELVAAGATRVKVRKQAAGALWLLMHRAPLHGVEGYRVAQLLGLVVRLAPPVGSYRCLIEVTR